MWYDVPTRLLLRSPLHRLLSKNTLLITVTGKKSGRHYTVPVNYVREGDALWIISRRERTWWRNLRGGAPVRLRLEGHELRGVAELFGSEKAVAAHLATYVRGLPGSARALGIHVKNGDPDAAELASAAQNWVMVHVSRMRAEANRKRRRR